MIIKVSVREQRAMQGQKSNHSLSLKEVLQQSLDINLEN